MTEIALVPNGTRSDFIRCEYRPDDEPVLRDTFLADVMHYDHLDLAGRVVVDCGANIGTTVLKALADRHARFVLAVEPEVENLGLLRRNVDAWAQKGMCDVWEAAVGNPKVTPNLTMHGTSGSAFGTRWENVGNAVPVVGLREVFDRLDGRMNDDESVALLKLDVEGGEYGFSDTWDDGLMARVERVAMEFHGGATHTAHLGPDDGRFGRLLTALCRTHSVQMFGRAEDGGCIYAHRYDL